MDTAAEEEPHGGDALEFAAVAAVEAADAPSEPSAGAFPAQHVVEQHTAEATTPAEAAPPLAEDCGTQQASAAMDALDALPSSCELRDHSAASGQHSGHQAPCEDIEPVKSEAARPLAATDDATLLQEQEIHLSQAESRISDHAGTAPHSVEPLRPSRSQDRADSPLCEEPRVGRRRSVMINNAKPHLIAKCVDNKCTSPMRGDRIPKIPAASTALPTLRNVRSSFETQIATMERLVHARSSSGSSFLSAVLQFASSTSRDLDLSGGFLEWVPTDDFRIGLNLLLHRPHSICTIDVSGYCSHEQGLVLLNLVRGHRSIVFVRCGGLLQTTGTAPVRPDEAADIAGRRASQLAPRRTSAAGVKQPEGLSHALLWALAEACVLNVEYCSKFERVTALRAQKALNRQVAAQLQSCVHALEQDESDIRQRIAEDRRKSLLKLSAVEHMQLVTAHRATKRREQEADFELMRVDVKAAEQGARWVLERRECSGQFYNVTVAFQHLRRLYIASLEASERSTLASDCHEVRRVIRRREATRRQFNREAVAALSLREFSDRRDTAVLEAQFRVQLSGCLSDLTAVAEDFVNARVALDDEDNRLRRVETDKIEKERHAFKEHTRHEDGRMHVERIRERERFFQRFHQSHAAVDREEAAEFRIIREIRLLLLQSARSMAAVSAAEAKLASFCKDECGLRLRLEGRTTLHSYAVVAVESSSERGDGGGALQLPWFPMHSLSLRFDAAQDPRAADTMSSIVDEVRQLRRKAHATLEDMDHKILFEGGSDRCLFAIENNLRPPLALKADVSPPVQVFLSQRRLVRAASVEFLLVAPSMSQGVLPLASSSASFGDNASPSPVQRKSKLRTAVVAAQLDAAIVHPLFEEQISCVGFECIGSTEVVMGIRWERVASCASSEPQSPCTPQKITLACSSVTDDDVCVFSEALHKRFCSSVSTLLNRLCYRRVLKLDTLDGNAAATKAVSAGRVSTASIAARVTLVGDGIPDAHVDSTSRTLTSHTPLTKRSFCVSLEQILEMDVRPPLFANGLPMNRPIPFVREHGCGAVLAHIRQQTFPDPASSPKGGRRPSHALDLGGSSSSSFAQFHSLGGVEDALAGSVHAGVKAPASMYKLPSVHNDSTLVLRLMTSDRAMERHLSLVLRLDPGVLSLDRYSQGTGALLRGKSITLSPCPKFFVLAPSTSEGAFRFPSHAEATCILEIDLGQDGVNTGDIVAFLQQCVTVSPVAGGTLGHGLAARIRMELEDAQDVVSIFEVPFTSGSVVGSPASPTSQAPPALDDAALDMLVLGDTPFTFVSPDPRRPFIMHPGPDPNLVGMPNTPDANHAVRLMPRLSVLLTRPINLKELRLLLEDEESSSECTQSPLDRWVLRAVLNALDEQQSGDPRRIEDERTTPECYEATTSPASPVPERLSGAALLASPIGDIKVRGVVDIRPAPAEKEAASTDTGESTKEWVSDPHDGRFVVFAPRHRGIGFSRRASQVLVKNKAFDVVSTGPTFTMHVRGCTLRELAVELQEVYVSTTHFLLRPRNASFVVRMDLSMEAPTNPYEDALPVADADTAGTAEAEQYEHPPSGAAAPPPPRSPPPQTLDGSQGEGPSESLHCGTPQSATFPPPLPPWSPFRTRVVLPIEVCEAQLPMAPCRKRISVVENGGWMPLAPFQFIKPDAAIWCDAFNGGRLLVTLSDGRGAEDTLLMRSMSLGPIRLKLVSVRRLPRDKPDAGKSVRDKVVVDAPSPLSTSVAAAGAPTDTIPSPVLPSTAGTQVVPPLATAAVSSCGRTCIVTTPRRKGPPKPTKVDDGAMDAILSPTTTELTSALSHRRGGRLLPEMMEEDITRVVFKPLCHGVEPSAPDHAAVSSHHPPRPGASRRLSNTTSPAAVGIQPVKSPLELRLSVSDLQRHVHDGEDAAPASAQLPCALVHFPKLEDAARSTNSNALPQVDDGHIVEQQQQQLLLERRIRLMKAAWLVREHLRRDMCSARGQEIMSLRRSALLPTMERTFDVYRDTTVAEAATQSNMAAATFGGPAPSSHTENPFGSLGVGIDGENDGAAGDLPWKRLGTMTVRKTMISVEFVDANQESAPVSSDDVLALLGNIAYTCDPCTALTNTTKLVEYTLVPADGPEMHLSQLLSLQKAESHPTVHLLRNQVFYAPNTIDLLCVGALPVTPYAQCLVQAHAGPGATAPLCFDGGRLLYEIIAGEHEGDNLYLMTRDEQLKAKNLYEMWRQEQVHLRNRGEQIAPQVEELLHRFQPYEGIGEVSATGKMMRTFVQNRQRGDDVNFPVGMTEAYNPLKVLVEFGPWQPEHCLALHVMTAMNAVGFRTSGGPGDRIVRISLTRGGTGTPLTTHVQLKISVRTPQLYIPEGGGRFSFAAKRSLRAPLTVVSVFPPSVVVDLGPDAQRFLRQGFLELRMVGVETGEVLFFRTPSAAPSPEVLPVPTGHPSGEGSKKRKPAPAQNVVGEPLPPALETTSGSFQLGLGMCPGAQPAPAAPPFCLCGRRVYAADGTTYLGTFSVATQTHFKLEFDWSSMCQASHIADFIKCLHMAVGRGVPPGVSAVRRVEVLLCTSEKIADASVSSPSSEGFTSFLHSLVGLDAAEGVAPAADDGTA